jgi:transaldolase
LAAKAPELQGKLAIANAKLAYQRYQAIFGGERFAALRASGALPQRLLWASNSTKNPDFPDLLYVETLIGPQTVNTMPPATYEAFREYGTVAQTLETGLKEAQAAVAALPGLGIDLAAVTERLEHEGVAVFAKAFDNLLHHLENKATALEA